MISKCAPVGALAVLAAALPLGCTSQGPRAAPVEPDKARAALVSVLDLWKAGKKIEDAGTANPPVVAQDFDWMAGAKLTDYKIIGDGTPEDANLRVRVQLSVRDTQGRAITKTVHYVVGTDPKLTVFRAME